MIAVNWSVVEEATLDWLSDLGYVTLHGPDILRGCVDLGPSPGIISV